MSSFFIRPLSKNCVCSSKDARQTERMETPFMELHTHKGGAHPGGLEMRVPAGKGAEVQKLLDLKSVGCIFFPQPSTLPLLLRHCFSRRILPIPSLRL